MPTADQQRDADQQRPVVMQPQHRGGLLRVTAAATRPSTVASPMPVDRLQKAETVATSIAVTPAVAYSRKRIAAPVKAAKPSVWPNE